MRTVPFHVVDSFTTEQFQGNPAGVFLDCDGLTADEMRRLAGEVHLESAFVLSGEDGHDFRLRYFTGVTEVPLCGHATLAATTVLGATGRIAPDAAPRFLTNVGTIGAECRTGEGGRPYVTQFQRAPEFGEALAPGGVAAALGCATEVIAGTGLPVLRVSTGTPWLYAPVPSRAHVDAAPANFEAIAALSRETGTYGVYVFAVEEEEAGRTSVWSRCFAPVAGLDEDPVTGSASGGLGCYLWRAALLGPDGGRLTARQGFGGGRGGTVDVEIGAAGGVVERVAVTGTATLLAQGAFTLP